MPEPSRKEYAGPLTGIMKINSKLFREIDVSVTDLKAKVRKRLAYMQERVSKLQDQLDYLESLDG